MSYSYLLPRDLTMVFISISGKYRKEASVSMWSSFLPHLVTVGKTVHMGLGRSLRSACECA